MKYSPEIIKKAQKMWKQGLSVNVIMAELGFEQPTAVYYWVNPARKESQKRATYRWMKKNPERLKVIQDRAIKKYYSSPKGKEAQRKRSKIKWKLIKSNPKLLAENNKQQSINYYKRKAKREHELRTNKRIKG